MKKVLIKETKNQFAWYSKKEGHIVEIERITLEGDAFVTKNGYLEITGKDMAPGLKSFISKGDFEHVYDIQVIYMPKGTPSELKNIILGGVFEAVKSDLHPDCFAFWAQDNIYVTIPAQFCKVIDPPVEEVPMFKHRIRVFDLIYNKEYKDLAGMEIDVYLDSDRGIDINNALCIKHPLTKSPVTLQQGDYMEVNSNEKPAGQDAKSEEKSKTDSQEIVNHIKELIDKHDIKGDLFGVMYFKDEKATTTPGLQKAYRNLCKEAQLAGYKAQLNFNTGEGQSAVFEERKPVGIVSGGPHNGKVSFNDGTLGEVTENPSYTGLWSHSKTYIKGQQFLKDGVFYETIVDSAPGDSTKRSFARIPGAITPSGYVASKGEVNNITEVQGQAMVGAIKINLDGAKEIDKVSAFRTWMDKAAAEASEEIKKYKAAFPGKLATGLIISAIVDDYMKEWHKRFHEVFGTGKVNGKTYAVDLLKPIVNRFMELQGSEVYRIGMDVANLKDHSAITIFKKVGEEFSVIDSWINGEKPFCASFLDRGIDLVRKEIDYAYGKAKEPAPKNPTEYAYRGGFRLQEDYVPGDIVQYKGIYYHNANSTLGFFRRTPDKSLLWKALPDQNFTPDPAKKFIVEVNTNATSLKNYLKRRQKQLKRAIGKYSSTGRPTPDYLKAELNEVEVQLIPKDGK